ncbi:MAG: MBL fold metallo-hydrolase [Dysgonamonadaceae bacterium]|jgi:glyoxylase-like metal-dependent hydrolase (beta-lactamase superfamily II)|nr:MBL fold metallo-hydrolase [Dysgonamonadaceae bacterium]
MKNKVIFFVLMMMTISSKSQNKENIFSVNTGDYMVHLLSEGQQTGNTSILIGATPEMIKEQIPDGAFPNATNAFLIQASGKNILVDTGFGRLLSDNLKELGLRNESIDAILLTHMHGDHIGGLLKNGQIVFPDIRLYISKPEYDYWLNVNNESALNILKAYKNQIVLFDPNELENITNELLPGISAIAVYGHTPGHTAYLIQSGDNKLLIWGDLTHAMAIQMPYPQIAVTYDVDPESAIRSREAILKYVSENKIPVAGMHIAYPAIGDVRLFLEGRYEFVPR